MAKIYTLICAQCGKTFERTRKPGKGCRTFCSNECSQLFHRGRQRNDREKDRAEEITQIGMRIGQMARRSGMSMQNFQSMLKCIAEIAEIEYSVAQ